MKFLLWMVLSFSLTSFAEETDTKIHGLHKSYAAYALMDIESGKIVKSHRADQAMILASVTKMLTYFFALNVLGPDHRFETELKYSGSIKDGVLEGDLYLIGHGDPYLGAPHLTAIAHALKLFGINKVSGNFYVDGSELNSAQNVSVLGLIDQADNPAISGLNVDFNRYDIWSLEGLVYPPVDSLNIKKVRKSAWGLKFDFEKIENNREYWFQHTKEYIPPVESLPTKNSSLFSGNYFKVICKQFSIDLPSPTEKKAPSDLKDIYTHKSIPMERIAELGLEYSNNLMAEVSLQMAARKLNKMPQDSKLSARTMMNWYAKKFPEIDWKKIQIVNGSGLTIHNQISPELFTKIMRALYKETISGRSYLSYLSINGHSGGIRRRINHPSLAFSIYAKTGSLYFVNNLGGYLIGKSGKVFAFAFFTTHDQNRSILSGNDSKQKKYLRRKSSDWNDLSSKAMDKKLEEWIKTL